MPSTSKKQKTDLELFVECWNIYSGIYLETDGEISRRMEAVEIYSEMITFLGKKSVTIGKGVKVTADYFPVDTGHMEFDWIVGFTLYVDSLCMGLIRGLSIRNNTIIISAEEMTIGFRVKE